MRCGRHIEDAGRELCMECSNRQHSYETGIAVFEYDDLMRRSMARFKFKGWRENSDFYISATVSRCRERILGFAPDVLIPVPVHRLRRMQRGYNQAELLAKGIGAALGIPVVTDLLLRKRSTGFQKKLGAKDRARNLERAFTCSSKYARTEVSERFARVMLVDDIYTTGSTMENCTKVLLDSGVAHVAILSISIGRGYA